MVEAYTFHNDKPVWTHVLYSYLSTRALGMILQSLRLVGAVGARNYVSGSFSQWVLSMTKTWTHRL